MYEEKKRDTCSSDFRRLPNAIILNCSSCFCVLWQYSLGKLIFTHSIRIKKAKYNKLKTRKRRSRKLFNFRGICIKAGSVRFTIKLGRCWSFSFSFSSFSHNKVAVPGDKRWKAVSSTYCKWFKGCMLPWEVGQLVDQIQH